MDSQLGKDISEIIHESGAPTDIQSLPKNEKAYVWINTGSTVSSVKNYFGRTQVVSDTPVCKTTLFVNDENKITAWHLDGRCR